MSLGLQDDDYARLLALRTGLRRFLRWSEEQARAAGLTAAQHQLLLAIRGHRADRGDRGHRGDLGDRGDHGDRGDRGHRGDRADAAPTVGEVADYLLLRHHSAVGLVDRAESAGLITRERDPNDHRVVRLRLTPEGARRLESLSAIHLAELERLGLQPQLWRDLTTPASPP